MRGVNELRRGVLEYLSFIAPGLLTDTKPKRREKDHLLARRSGHVIDGQHARTEDYFFRYWTLAGTSARKPLENQESHVRQCSSYAQPKLRPAATHYHGSSSVVETAATRIDSLRIADLGTVPVPRSKEGRYIMGFSQRIQG